MFITVSLFAELYEIYELYRTQRQLPPASHIGGLIGFNITLLGMYGRRIVYSILITKYYLEKNISKKVIK